MKHPLKPIRVRIDNPRFLRDYPINFTYFTTEGHECCDATSIANWPDGTTREAKASYEYWDGDWHLIAN